MRFPLKQTVSIAKSMSKKKRSKIEKFPLVLMLEPLFACDLKCSGCGRIREYKDELGKRMSVDEALKASRECDAPVVSVCGGEPLIYPEIKELVSKLLEQGRVVYLCTNGQRLVETISNFKPHPRFNFNIHLDGLSDTHDKITGSQGSFQKALNGIRKAKEFGFTVCTNTTVYSESSVDELKALIELLTREVDGVLMSPGFEYGDVADKNFFLKKQQVIDKFKQLNKQLRGKKVWTSPIFLDFLIGEKDLNCTPWGNVTYNVLGWKAPCYLITDNHYKDYKDFLSSVEWEKYGPKNDDRCKNCMAHCGFEATAAMIASSSLKEALRYAKWLLWK